MLLPASINRRRMLSYFRASANDRSSLDRVCQLTNNILICGVIVQWIRLCLQSCHPGFESQAHHLHFYQIKFELFHVEKTKNKQKEAGIGPFFKKKSNWIKLSKEKTPKIYFST